ncbi:hypothetical protein OG871_36585 [Kitasatospora sp. NBC_00374]|uniref:hypothetical protein n=1 Tax=Kitasatospora sp. NBC_00374 TaxID=2975964 RepID=UPI0030E4413A
MYLVSLSLTGSASPMPSTADAHAVHDILWAHAGPADGLEHVRAHAGPEGIDLVLFISATEQSGALAQAADLLRRAGASKTLSRYSVPDVM